MKEIPENIFKIKNFLKIIGKNKRKNQKITKIRNFSVSKISPIIQPFILWYVREYEKARIKILPIPKYKKFKNAFMERFLLERMNFIILKIIFLQNIFPANLR